MTYNLTRAEVRALLAAGHDLIYYRETYNTFAGWAIASHVVHGATVNAMLRRGEIREVVVPASARHVNGWARRAVLA